MKTPFRGFTAILYKEFLVVLRDPLTLFFMLFPPLVEMIAFGYALDTDVKHMATLVLDGMYLRPARLQELGFAFRFANLEAALSDLLIK